MLIAFTDESRNEDLINTSKRPFYKMHVVWDKYK